MVNPATLPAGHFTGRWLRSTANPELGHGFCKEKRGSQFVLSYVDIPGVAEHEFLVDPRNLIDKAMPNGTRVWVKGTPYGWHAGEISRSATHQRYHVSLVGFPNEFLLHQDQFYVRWSRPLEDPSAAVGHGLSDSPTYYEARSALLTEFVRQRQVSRGLSGIISAPVNLYHHQIDTVARVLADPVIRYLLADEVGLGKTIEAGLVIRQVMIDDPEAEVLVLCPGSLVGQWESELRDRLALGTALDDQHLVVLSHEGINQNWNLDHFALVVIDEAHNLLSRVPDGSPTRLALDRVPALLALSATPMRGDLETFRRLLGLVDPNAFRDTTVESFRQRLNEREQSARELQVLASRRASVRQKAAVVESLKRMFPDDINIRDLAARCAGSDGPTGQPWFELAEYIRETYRLSRRMIRHRRDGELTNGYAVAGRRPTYVEVNDPGRVYVDEFLELFRLRLDQASGVAIYSQAVLHSLAGPIPLHEFLKTQLALPPGHPKGPSDDHRSLFESTVAHLEMAGVDARLDAALEVVRERVDAGLKVVVCSSFRDLAEKFEDRAIDEIGEFKVFEHYRDMDARDRDNAVADFLNGGGGVVLVADRSMEEGRNLQEAEVLVNLDLPLDASRLDQRIGRLDRYAVRPDPAEVVVFTEPSSEWVSGHVRLLAEGTGVLEGSVSTIQRMLSDLLQGVLDNLLPHGLGALYVDTEQLRMDLDTERDEIDLLEEMESVTSATVFTSDAFAEFVEYEDADDETLRQAVKRLTSGNGSLALKPVESYDGVLKFGGAKEIGLPTDEVPALHRLLLAPKTYSRKIAANRHGVAPFRIGDPLVDWLEDYLRADERGRAYAVVRPVAGLTTPALWLHSEFLVDFDDSHLSMADGAARRRLARRADAVFPPVILETWTDPSGRAPESLVAEQLDLPFDAKRDKLLRGANWEAMLDEFPAWTQLIKQSAEVGRELIEYSEPLTTGIEAALHVALAEIAKRHSILRARSLRLPTEREREAATIEFEFEEAAGNALIAGIQLPSVRMVASGVCVLWPEDRF